MADLVAFFIIVACGATMFKQGIHINDAKDAAVSLAEFDQAFADESDFVHELLLGGPP